MKVILLCAGYATRLYPLTKDTPKPLLPVSERPILEWILDRVKEVPNVNAVYIVTNDKFARQFEDWSKEAAYPWPVETVNDKTTSNDNRLGAIGDLAFVLRQKKVGKEDILVVAGDNLFDFDLRHFVAASAARRPHASIAVYDVKDKVLAKQYGLVESDREGRVTAFYEKPENPPTTLASCGLYWLPAETRELLDSYLASGHNPDQPGHYMRWLAETHRLYAVPLEGQWLDIGDHASYQKANEVLRTKKA